MRDGPLVGHRVAWTGNNGDRHVGRVVWHADGFMERTTRVQLLQQKLWGIAPSRLRFKPDRCRLDVVVEVERTSKTGRRLLRSWFYAPKMDSVVKL